MSFRTRTPDGRKTVLYRRYCDLRSRVLSGQATRCPWLYVGLELAWGTFGEFRAFALANGFTKTNDSPDRDDPTRGYVPGNVTFRPRRDNFARSRGSAYYGRQNTAGA